MLLKFLLRKFGVAMLCEHSAKYSRFIQGIRFHQHVRQQTDEHIDIRPSSYNEAKIRNPMDRTSHTPRDFMLLPLLYFPLFLSCPLAVIVSSVVGLFIQAIGPGWAAREHDVLSDLYFEITPSWVPTSKFIVFSLSLFR